MIPVFVLGQVLDLVTFLIAVTTYPQLAGYEIGPIGWLYANLGGAAASAYKLGFAAAVVYLCYIMALSRPKYARFVLGVGIVVGWVGVLANTTALWALG
jgi:hypothetical protein